MKKAEKGQRKEKFKKYQYTKPYKDRDRSKDFGKDLPLKKSGRLKFPQKPQYYTLYTVPRLPNTHPFFNIRNKDIQDVKRNLQQARKDLEKLQKNSKNQNLPKKSGQGTDPSQSASFQLRSSAFNSKKSGTNSNTGAECASNRSSLGVVTITNLSNSSNPFHKGYTVTSGPKVYAKPSDNANSDKQSIGASTPKVSVLSGKQKSNEVASELDLSGVSRWMQNASV